MDAEWLHLEDTPMVQRTVPVRARLHRHTSTAATRQREARCA